MKVKSMKGFTLAELLIVMAIVVVLAAVAVPTFGRQLETARETSDMELIRNAYTEALSLAIIDASDGTLDGKKGTTDLTPETPVDFKISGTNNTAKVYEMKMADKLTQTNLAWQYVNNTVGGVTVPTVTTANDQYVKFTFKLDTSGNGGVEFAASSPIETAAAFSS